VDNVPPSITPVSDQITPEDAQFLLQVIADDVPADTLTFADNTTLFDIDAVTGEITFTPINSDVGIYLINITVTDDDGGLDFTVFQLTIINTNDPPHITSSPVTTATESTQYEYSVIVEDDDLLVDPFETITYSLDSAPAGMSINSSSGIISWVPAHDQAGLTLEVIVEVTDGELIDTQSFNVTVTNLNDEPVITSTPITEAVEDESYTYDVDATDVDTGDVLTYSLDQAPPGMNIDSLSGVISWEPEN
jgi:hypothetical protein